MYHHLYIHHLVYQQVSDKEPLELIAPSTDYHLGEVRQYWARTSNSYQKLPLFPFNFVLITLFFMSCRNSSMFLIMSKLLGKDPL